MRASVSVVISPVAHTAVTTAADLQLPCLPFHFMLSPLQGWHCAINVNRKCSAMELLGKRGAALDWHKHCMDRQWGLWGLQGVTRRGRQHMMRP